MITKSLIIFSIILNMFGLTNPANKFDDAVIRDQANSKKTVSASENNLTDLPEISIRPIIKSSATNPTANAKHYVLVDLDSDEILAQSDKDARVPIASTTKIMTAIVALENYKLTDVATISETATTQIGADAYLRPGEKIDILNLLNCMLIKSGNDSAYAIAEYMNKPGETGIKSFVDKMNEKAKELGMNNTHYEDSSGLNTTGYSSAYDLYLATRHALKDQTFVSIVKKSSAVAKNVDSTIWHELNNSNRLVNEYQYPGAIGVKTGYMPEAGHCLVGAAKRDGHTLVAIVLDTFSDTASASADESRRLLDWGFNNIEWR